MPSRETTVQITVAVFGLGVLAVGLSLTTDAIWWVEALGVAVLWYLVVESIAGYRTTTAED